MSVKVDSSLVNPTLQSGIPLTREEFEKIKPKLKAKMTEVLMAQLPELNHALNLLVEANKIGESGRIKIEEAKEGLKEVAKARQTILDDIKDI
jgi:hypothetical protein